MTKKILFLTSTRADYGKLKSLMLAIEADPGFELFVFVTGMHMLANHGFTRTEVEGYKNIHVFINQRANDSMDTILGNTISGLGNYVSCVRPDLMVVHGDKVEALAGAIVGALNNLIVAHVEGGEVSGTIDGSIRHSVSKLAHIHFAANDDAKKNLVQMGEDEKSVFIIGSPDMDLMNSSSLPTLPVVKKHYDIPFQKYSILAYHPVTTSLHHLFDNVCEIMAAASRSGKNFVVIYPNNDPGANIIIEQIERLKGNTNFRIFPSLRFEYFLVLLRNCEFIMGNSSAGIREAPFYSIPTINIGSRQNGRFTHENIIDVGENCADILDAIKSAATKKTSFCPHFGEGKSTTLFMEKMRSPELWEMSIQKSFIQRDTLNTEAR